jgi:DNA-binding response OmpR family regulator
MLSEMAVRLLLIDDDARLCELLASYLNQHDFLVTRAADGQQGLAMQERETYDVVLLDLMMPGLDGLEVCRRIRKRSQIPILMLTAKGDETDRVVGLELGADDYITKPFGPRELLARLRAVLRRTSPEHVQEQLQIQTLTIVIPERKALLANQLLDLTGIEFDILVALAKRAGQVIPRQHLLSEAGRTDVNVGDRTIDVHVSHLRQKLGDDPKNPTWIKTVRGIGYVMSKEPLESTPTPPARLFPIFVAAPNLSVVWSHDRRDWVGCRTVFSCA